MVVADFGGKCAANVSFGGAAATTDAGARVDACCIFADKTAQLTMICPAVACCVLVSGCCGRTPTTAFALHRFQPQFPSHLKAARQAASCSNKMAAIPTSTAATLPLWRLACTVLLKQVLPPLQLQRIYCLVEYGQNEFLAILRLVLAEERRVAVVAAVHLILQLKVLLLFFLFLELLSSCCWFCCGS